MSKKKFMKNAQGGFDQVVQTMQIEKENNIFRTGGAGVIDLTGKNLIMFDGDCQLNWGNTEDTTNFINVTLGSAFSIEDGVTACYVNADVGYIIN